MISFNNGHSFEFCCASGALGFNGNGWWFEQPWRWLGLLRPGDMTIITKTLTCYPRRGNYRWYAPWRCVRFITDGVVNAFGLTNDGYLAWIHHVYPKLPNNYKVIVSIMIENGEDIPYIASDLNRLKNLVGVQLNFCPNVKHADQADSICELVTEFIRHSNHPTTVKLNYTDQYMEVCRRLDDKGVAAFDLINAVQWRTVFQTERSPLNKYGLVGSISGPKIRPYAREASTNYRAAKFRTPLISGGSIDSYEEVEYRFDTLKADAVPFGTIFMGNPTLANQIIDKWRQKCWT